MNYVFPRGKTAFFGGLPRVVQQQDQRSTYLKFIFAHPPSTRRGKGTAIGNGRPFINREDEPPLTDDLKSGISWANEVAAVDDDLAGLHTEAAGAMGDEEGRRHDEEWA